MVDALGGALAGQLVVLAQKGRQLEGLEVMRQQHLWGGRSWPTLAQQAHVAGGGRGCDPGPWQIGIDIQVEPRRAPFDPAQHQVLDGVVADSAQVQSVPSPQREAPQNRKVSRSRRTCTYSRLPGLPIRASRRRRRVGNASGSCHPDRGAAWSRAPIFCSSRGR